MCVWNPACKHSKYSIKTPNAFHMAAWHAVLLYDSYKYYLRCTNSKSAPMLRSRLTDQQSDADEEAKEQSKSKYRRQTRRTTRVLNRLPEIRPLSSKEFWRQIRTQFKKYSISRLAFRSSVVFERRGKRKSISIRVASIIFVLLVTTQVVLSRCKGSVARSSSVCWEQLAQLLLLWRRAAE